VAWVRERSIPTVWPPLVGEDAQRISMEFGSGGSNHWKNIILVRIRQMQILYEDKTGRFLWVQPGFLPDRI
jgi:hypothetical protein